LDWNLGNHSRAIKGGVAIDSGIEVTNEKIFLGPNSRFGVKTLIFYVTAVLKGLIHS